jgi:hypothetical protein
VNRARKAAAAILLSTTVSLLATEVILRSYFPRRTFEVLAASYPAMFNESDYLPYRLRPNYRGRLARAEFDTEIRINSLGYRGEEFTRDKGDALRVLVIGDSYTFGWGVEDTETFSAHLQNTLRARYPGRRIEVINAGFAACNSPDTYYLYLKQEGLALHPDLILVGLFLGNDLDSPFALEHEWYEKDAQGLPLRIRNLDSQVQGHYLLPRPVPMRYRVPVLSRSHVFQGMFDIWWSVAPMLRSALPDAVATLHAQPPDERVPPNYRLEYSERTEMVFNRVRGLFQGMNQLAKDVNTPLAFMLIPEAFQMNPEALKGLPGDIEKPQRVLAEFFQREGIRYLDFLPWMREKAAGRQMYFPQDGHWNVLANQLAGERLAEFVSTEWLAK